MKWNIRRKRGVRRGRAGLNLPKTPVSAADVEHRALEIGRELLKSAEHRAGLSPPGSGPISS